MMYLLVKAAQLRLVAIPLKMHEEQNRSALAAVSGRSMGPGKLLQGKTMGSSDSEPEPHARNEIGIMPIFA
jgi:hypothetical protein